jgi:hypothetical protein
MQPQENAQPSEYRQLLREIRIGFLRQDTNLTAFCRQNGIDPRNAYQSLKGQWKGVKAQAVRQRIIDAARGMQ